MLSKNQLGFLYMFLSVCAFSIMDLIVKWSDTYPLGEVDGFSSRINADTRSLLTRIKIDNEKFELIPGSLLEVTVKYNERRSLGIPDTSVMLEGDNAYVYKVVENNNVNKIKIETGIRNKGSVEVISGLNEGDIIVAEGLKKINPKGKIKPINK